MTFYLLYVGAFAVGLLVDRLDKGLVVALDGFYSTTWRALEPNVPSSTVVIGELGFITVRTPKTSQYRVLLNTVVCIWHYKNMHLCGLP